MTEGEVDENGWAAFAVAPWSPSDAWSLISPESTGRVDVARWAHQAEKFFAASLTLACEKRYPNDSYPIADTLKLTIAPARDISTATVVEVLTLPLDRAPKVIEAARAGVAAIGGAGFDVLLGRGRRLWQVLDRVSEGGDPRAPLALAAVLASILLAPIVPPEGGTIFGVKGARERLALRGWRS